tara:strand:+ start:473 stop:685 length:213 start_codon:yes stop_codon:yes gene_type:complete
MTYPPHHKENLEVGTIFIDSDEEFMIVTDISKKEVTLRVLASPLQVDHSRIGMRYTYQEIGDDFIVKIIA